MTVESYPCVTCCDSGKLSLCCVLWQWKVIFVLSVVTVESYLCVTCCDSGKLFLCYVLWQWKVIFVLRVVTVESYLCFKCCDSGKLSLCYVLWQWEVIFVLRVVTVESYLCVTCCDSGKLPNKCSWYKLPEAVAKNSGDSGGNNLRSRPSAISKDSLSLSTSSPSSLSSSS